MRSPFAVNFVKGWKKAWILVQKNFFFGAFSVFFQKKN